MDSMPSNNMPDGSVGAIPEPRRAILAGVAGLAAGALLAGRASGGPLDPPAGPILSTGKTLTEVEPRVAINQTNTPGDATSVFRITQPGSYYLTQNVTGVSGRHGIRIASSRVTIDLNGLNLTGVPGSLDGIAVDGIRDRLRIRNGTVTSWGGRGVMLFISTSSESGVIEDMIVSGNQGDGIVGINAMIARRCVSSGNVGVGFIAPGYAVVRDCVARNNSGPGFQIAFGVVSRCNASGNTQSGFAISTQSIVSDCVASANTQNGIQVGFISQIRGNVCAGNGAAGILATGADNIIDGNTSISNATGIRVDGTGNLIIRNACSSNSPNYNFVASNRYGQVVDITATGSAAVSGNTAASTLGSTNPWANFAF